MNRLAVTVGVAAAVSGIAIVLRPELVGATAGLSLVVVFVGVLALLEGVNAVRDRLGGDRRRAAPPDVERQQRFGTPGDDVDEAIARLGGPPSQARDETYADLRHRTRQVAVATLAAEGYTESEARAALADGSWTDDGQAAALFADPTAVPDATDLRDRVMGESTYRLRVRRAIDVIAGRDRRRRGGGDGG